LLDLTSHNPNDSVLGFRALLPQEKSAARSAVMSAVIVLNTDNTALHTVSIKHAIRMLVREVGPWSCA
jgi:hypothetical protein